jgi:hypothetical protein
MESPNLAYAYVFLKLSEVLKKFNCIIESIPDQQSYMITSRGCKESINYLQVQIEFNKNLTDFTLSYDGQNAITITYADLYYHFYKVQEWLESWIEKHILN